MRSHDASDELVGFMESTLRERGLTDVTVSSYTEPETGLEHIYVQKQLLPHEKLAYKVSFDPLHNAGQIKQKLASESEYIAEEFRKEITDRFQWDDNSVDVSIYNEGWAECHRCDTKVTAPSATYTFHEIGECSDPYPVQRDMGRAVEEMTAEQKTIFKMYLLGILKEECDYGCPNSRYSGLGR